MATRRKTTELQDELLDKLIETVETTEDLTGPEGLARALLGRLVEKSLSAELTDHLGYDHGGARGGGSNARNGTTAKTLMSESGSVTVDIPRDRDGTFEPKLVKKHQRRLEGFNDRILQLYARGMSTREIQDFFKEAYDSEISPTLISRVTDAVLDDVEDWRSRRLNEIYPILYLDGLVVKVTTDGRVQNRTVYVALGVNMQGHKEVLGLWIGASEGASFWLHVITELKNRGVEDVLIACCDGLKGFPEAVEAVFPRTIVQTCVVHMVRNSLRLVSWKNRKTVARALRPIYRADTVDAARRALEAFDQEWGQTYPSIVRSWETNWDRISPFFEFPKDIRRAIYTTNAIEALNSQLRKALKPKGHFPTENAVYKVLYLALSRAAKKWTMPIPNWDLALQQFDIRFDGRLGL